MNVSEKIVEHEKRIVELQANIIDEKKKKEKGWKFKIPGKVKKEVLKSNDKAAAIFVGQNRLGDWKVAEAKDGLWWIENGKYDDGKPRKDSYTYEEAAMFHLRIKKNKLVPFIILFSWRLTPGGGKAEEMKSKWIDEYGDEWRTRLIGGKDDEMIAELAGIKKFGQQTIIRGIEQAEIEKDMKKKGQFGWVIWAILGIGIVFLILKFLKVI